MIKATATTFEGNPFSRFGDNSFCVRQTDAHEPHIHLPTV